jgi:predicted secreted protein
MHRLWIINRCLAHFQLGYEVYKKTEWDFGNGVQRVTLERLKKKNWNIIRYAASKEIMTLFCVCNEGKVIEKYFLIEVHDPAKNK